LSAEILDGSGRFVLLSTPAAFPFKDMVTGTPEGPVFDLSVDFDGYDGVGYLKAEHVIEMAHVLGMSTKEETLEMRARISELEVANKAVPTNVKRLLDGIDNLVAEFNSGIPTADDIASDLGLSGNSQASNDDNRQGTSEESGKSGESDGTPDSDKADGTDKPAIKNSKPAIDKGPNKFSAGPIDGFGFGDS